MPDAPLGCSLRIPSGTRRGLGVTSSHRNGTSNPSGRPSCHATCLPSGRTRPPAMGPTTARPRAADLSMTSSIRVVPLSQVAEIGTRRRLQRDPDGTPRVDAVDVYVLLNSLDDGGSEERGAAPARQDALRFVKTVEDGGPGQISRLEDFARTVSALIGRPL